jgi:hypothetical protein
MCDGGGGETTGRKGEILKKVERYEKKRNRE